MIKHSKTLHAFAILALYWLQSFSLLASNQNVNPLKPGLLPTPQSIEWNDEAISLKYVKVKLPDIKESPLKVAQLKSEIKKLLSDNKLKQSNKAKKQLLLKLGKVNSPNHWKGQADEAYELVTEKRGVIITANTVKGLYYGVQTLRQLMVRKNGKTTVAACKIHDYPAFKIRGFMQDVGRNFQTLDLLKLQLDTFARYKINTFHFHVTEYHGWRLESKIYPELQRLDTFTRKPGKFYTQEEFKELVDYCWARNITLIPEFDTPGHSDAFRKALGIPNMKDPKAKEAMVKLFDELCSLVPKEKMPYIHVGTDEASKPAERVNSDYLPALHEVIQKNDRDVIGWVHGMHIKGDTKQIQQTWASSKPYAEMRHIDSRSNYLNYLQTLNFATRMLFQQPCRQPHGDEMNLGGILCYWPDTKIDDENQGMLNSPVFSAIIAYSESVWTGVEQDRPEFWVRIPPRGTAEHASYVDFEERLIEQRDRFLTHTPFRGVRTHNMDWRYLGPCTETQFEELDKGIIKDNYTVDGKRYRWSDPIHGASIELRHFFGFHSHVPSYPKGKNIVWANTYIYSPKDQTVDAWIDFNTIAASGYKGGEKLRPQGQWDMNKECNIWINGERIAPPVWQSTAVGFEHALTNESYAARPPSQITLKKGWNSVLVKAGRSYKWVFSFSPINIGKDGMVREVEGLKYSPYKKMELQSVEPKHGATIPQHRFNVNWWKPRFDQKLEESKTAKCDILFVGDSITNMWENRSGKLWEERYVSRNAINMGYSGDQTRHVLWRIDNGEMNHFKPKVAVVMIGTNNAQHQRGGSPQQTADGVRAIIDRIHAKSPETKVLLLGIFPRGANANDRWRLVNDKTNAIISKFHNGNSVHFLDISSAFLDKNGNLSKSIMPDLLHPNEAGYKIWADAMEPKLKELLQASKAPGAAYNSAVVPVPKLENDFYDWHQRHEQVKELVAKRKDTQLIFIGDSITHMFGGLPKSRIARGASIWEQNYAQYNPINMGFGWDRTQNMLWRLENGALEGISPKVAVVLAGTNNLTGTNNAPTNTPEEIVAGIKKICETVHRKSPKTKILLLGVLPRHGEELNEKIFEINKLILALKKERYITVKILWKKFADKNGQQNMKYFHDKAHPNARGYQLWAETIEPTLKQLLK